MAYEFYIFIAKKKVTQLMRQLDNMLQSFQIFSEVTHRIKVK